MIFLADFKFIRGYPSELNGKILRNLFRNDRSNQKMWEINLSLFEMHLFAKLDDVSLLLNRYFDNFPWGNSSKLFNISLSSAMRIPI